MKAIAYNITPKDKEWLVLANYKKHDITIIANSLTLDTLNFAAGKEALIVFNQDPIDQYLIHGLQRVGIKYIATHSFECGHIDLTEAKKEGIKVANIPFQNGSDIENMKQVIANLDNWGAGKCVGKACCCQKQCAIKLETPK